MGFETGEQPLSRINYVKDVHKRNSILKSSNNKSLKKDHHLKWDEMNLDANEEIKKTLDCQKISEPPTPYHAPLDNPDNEEELENLNIDDDDDDEQSTRISVGNYKSDFEEQERESRNLSKQFTFEEKRRSHYKMEADFKRARELASKAMEEAEKEES